MADQSNRLLPDRLVALRYSIVSRTISRWDKNPELGFPKAIRINQRKYRSEAELDAWVSTAE